MSSSSLRIILKNPPSWLPEHMADEDGNYSFDLNVDTDVAITKQIDELTDIGSMKQDTVRNFTLPVTKKNIALFGEVGNPNAFNFYHTQPLNVEIQVGLYTLPEQQFRVRGTGDTDFEVEAFGEANKWIQPLSDLSIKSLPFGVTPAYDWDFIFDLFNNKNYYQDGELPIFIPLVNYGKRLRKNAVSLEDLRVWHSPLYILRTGFCSIGWKFICPMLETELGRRTWIYILSENYANSSAATNKAFNAVLTSDTPLVPASLAAIGTVKFDNDFTPPGFDNGGFYEPLTGEYQGSGTKADFSTIIEVDGIGQIGGLGAVLIDIVKINTITSQGTILAQLFEQNLPSGTHILTLTAHDVVLSPDEIVLVAVLEASFPGVIKADTSRFYNAPKADVISEGDLIDTQVIIADEYKVLDLLKGMAHLLNWKAETDSTNKTASFYPEDGANWYGEGKQEAFFKENHEAKDWTDKVECESLRIDLNNKNKRNFLLEFKNDSADFKANNLESTNDEVLYSLHSKNIDSNDESLTGTTKSPNPFFAPTIDAFDWDVRWFWNSVVTQDSAPYIPHIWKDDKDENGVLPPVMLKIVPRILLTHPNGNMQVPIYLENGVETSGDIRVYDSTFPGTIRNLQVYVPCSQAFPKGFEAITGAGLIPLDDKAIVYGTDRYNTDLPGNYEIFYKKAVNRLYRTVALDFLIKISFLDFINFSARDKIFIKYNSSRYGQLRFYARVGVISDFVITKNIPTPVLLQPNDSNFNLDCCNCLAYARFVGLNPPTLDFDVLLVGSCGEIISFKWILTNLGAQNIGIVGSDELQVVKVGGNGDPLTFHFRLDVETVTTCGTFNDSIEYPA